MNTYETWSIFINLLIAIGTIGAVVVAIFGNRIKAFLFRAKLSMKILNKNGELTNLNNGDRVFYYHIKFKNDRPSVRIKNCSVFLKKIQKREIDGEYYDLPLAVPPIFSWAPKESSPAAIDIVSEQVLDFGFLPEKTNPYRPSNGPQFAPVVTPIFNSFKGFLSPKQSFRYYLEIIADNYMPKDLAIVQVSWNGEWSDKLNEMESNLKIEIIKPIGVS